MTFVRKFMGFTGYGLTILFFVLVIGSGAFGIGTISFETPWKVLFFSMIGFAIFFVVFKLILDKIGILHKDLNFTIFAIILATVPRVTWVYLVRTVPEIDFLRFHEYTKALISGDYTAYADIRRVFPHISGFPLLQSFYYRIFGDSVWTGVSFNILCSVLTVIVIYFFVSELLGKNAGRIAAVIYALWPNQIMFSSLIASEPLFTLLFMLSFLLFVKALKYMYDYKMFIYGGLLAVALAFAQIVRPISSTFIPTLILFLFLYYKGFKADKRYLVNCIALIVSVILVYSVTLWGINFAFEEKTLYPLGEVKTGMSLFAGTSAERNGMWNPEVTEILMENNYDYELSHEEGLRRAIENITSDPKAFWELVKTKFPAQWALDDFGLYWSTVTLYEDSSLTRWINESWDNREIVYVISQSYYLGVMLLGLIYSCYLIIKRNIKCPSGLSIIMIIGFTLLHCFAEIQSRYHYSLMPFFILMAVGGIVVLEGGKKYENSI